MAPKITTTSEKEDTKLVSSRSKRQYCLCIQLILTHHHKVVRSKHFQVQIYRRKKDSKNALYRQTFVDPRRILQYLGYNRKQASSLEKYERYVYPFHNMLEKRLFKCNNRTWRTTLRSATEKVYAIILELEELQEAAWRVNNSFRKSVRHRIR